MAEKTRNSVWAVMEETTEGTPVVPSGATDYVPLQDGFTVTPAFTELENNELSGSIGNAKSTLGFEEPVMSSDVYIKHSGVEGQEPQQGLIIESALGAKSVAVAEYDTVAASTTTVVNVDAGEGATFERGEALLVKDGTNGYGIRNISSIATDALTLNSALSGAPASGVNLGQAVLYKPGENHPSLSMWEYRGNGGAIEMIAGTRVTDMTINVPAGEFVNGSFSFGGIAYYFNPVTITASNKYIDFDDAGGEENASVEEKTYKDPHQLAAAIEAAMDALTADNITVTYSDTTGKYTIASDGGTLSLLWNTGTNTANTIGGTIGYVVSADDTGATSYAADSAMDWSSPYTPSFDSTNPLVAKNNEARFGDDTTCYGFNSATFSVANTKTDILSVCEESGKSGSVIGERAVTVELQGLYERYDVDKFRRFREGDTTQFMYNFGIKSGDNWVAGKSVNMWIPEATITSFELVDNDGLVDVSMTLTAFVDSGKGEFFINFL